MGAGLGLGLSWLRQEAGWPHQAVEWGLLGLMVLVLAYAGYAAYRYYRALLEDDDY